MQAKRSLLDKVISDEIAYTSNLIMCAPRNESAWNYLLGLFSKAGGLVGRERHEAARWIEQVRSLCSAVLAAVPSCAPALSALAEVYFVAAQAAAEVVVQGGSVEDDNGSEARLALESATSSAVKLFDGLCTADPIRSMFYKSRKQLIRQHEIGS